jgi:hypothetical protein
MALSQSDTLLIQSVDKRNVERTFAGLRPFIRRNEWLGKNNKYSADTVSKIVGELKAGGIQNKPHLAQYIAASSLLHCSDGWSYLGRSILALLRGDPHRCRHFAYYAELRAAMSLLATQGVGVFDKRHVVIDAPNSVRPLTGSYGTHQFAWDSLKCWSVLPLSGSAFATIIRPNGITLNDWFSSVGGGVVVAPQAEKWFQQWGMDLKLGLDDRNSRNESSYRPDGLPVAWYIEGKDVITFVRTLWSSFEPSAESRFDMLDKQILRIAIEQFFKGTNGVPPASAPRKFRQLIEKIVGSLSFSSDVEQLWTEFLVRQKFEDDASVLRLSSLSPKAKGTSYASVISRAALLLRLASGSAADLLLSAGMTAELTMFWWNKLGVGRGLWEGSKDADELVDLWADINILLSELDSFQEKHPEDQSFLRLGRELGPTIVGLGGFERVAIWGLSPSI